MLYRIFKGVPKTSDQKKLILNSGLFDPDWYAKQQGLKGGARKALGHFLKWRGAYDPSERFSSGAYLFDNADVRTAGLNPLLHYLRYGIGEGRVAKDICGRISGACERIDVQTEARLRRHFDPSFYSDANPDLPKKGDLFTHFMRVGWRQNRDPAPWFSIEDYMADNNLVGENPFTHYVLSGADLGCRTHNSKQKPVICSQLKPGKRPRLAVVAMVRNEADIIGLFTSHLLALFDDIVIVDHQSDDGTAAFLATLSDRFPQVRALTLCEPAYIQSIAMTHVVRDVPLLRRADWVFFLDADEFLPFQTRNAFHQALEPYHGCPIISMRWRNVVPAKYWSDVVDLTKTTEFFLPPSFSSFKKVAFQPSKLNIDQTEIAQGNHAMIDAFNRDELRAFEAKFHLAHIPIRSKAQLTLKLKQGIRSYQLLGQEHYQGQGTHWQRMARAISMRAVHDGHLNAMAVNYSEEGQSMDPIGRQDLSCLGYKIGTLNIAKQHTGLNVRRTVGSDATKFQQFAQQNVPIVTRLKTCANGDLVRADSLTHGHCQESLKKA